ncbi:serine protease inhibitor [Synechococcus sp. MW101C3]|uniref:serine protease inhibitor n=1 Tax=Synechococcus sp. MW101C3 TaxID=210768 RepID=UPI0011817CF2|nr:serine protease inhibitor [Synechococcus sp. MW101C3]
MTASSLSSSRRVPAGPFVARSQRPAALPSARAATWNTALAWAPAVLALSLVLVVSLLAPEAPEREEGICVRHNGPVACRVW